MLMGKSCVSVAIATLVSTESRPGIHLFRASCLRGGSKKVSSSAASCSRKTDSN